MNAVILHIPRSCPFSPEALFLALGGYAITDSRYAAQTPIGNIYLDHYEDLLDEYEEQALTNLIKLIDEPRSYVLHWRGERALEQFLRMIPEGIGAVVDNANQVSYCLDYVRNLPIEEWLFCEN